MRNILFICCFLLAYNSGAQENNIEGLWENIVFKKGGCLVGKQYYRTGASKRIGPGVFRSHQWLELVKKDKNALCSFLLSRLDSNEKTKVHTCPFFDASEGEMAVYALQHLLEINWYDFEAFSAYKNKDVTGGEDNAQAWLQAILKDDNKRKLLMNKFQAML